jgi:hypothetical protein
MASGKQTSFQFGEVSPSLRFRSDAVSYTAGLSKLKNMYVRRAGGVSNRSGTTIVSDFVGRFKKPGESTYYTPEEILDLKIFYFFGTDSFINEIACVKTGSVNLLYFNQNIINTVLFQNTSETVLINAPDPNVINFTYTKDGIFVSPSCSFSGIIPSIDSGNIFVTFDGKAQLLHKDPIFNVPTVTGNVIFGASGKPPFLPASYMITVVLNDGTEETVGFVKNNTYDPAAWDENTLGSKIVLPTVELSTYLKLEYNIIGTKLQDVKFFNLYRSTNATGGRNAYYKLVSRQSYDKIATTIIFNDYGAESIGETPPLDNSHYGNTFLTDAVNSVYYQQRLILGFSLLSTKLKPGEALASKLGAPKQLISPIIFTETGAFTFSVPIQDGGDIVSWLSMDRLIAFTEKAVYVIRGGEQGVLTPTTVNPLRISEEGCANNIQPKMSGRRGYYINNRKTKLMAIEFGVDGNLAVYEASLFSEHLINKNVKEIEVISGIEDTIFILTEEGEMVRVTVTDEGAHGFSNITTKGKIKRIFRYGNLLRALIERNGIKYLEQFSDRFDKEKDEEIFTDATIGFGFRLALETFTNSGSYIRYINGLSPIFRNIDFNYKANIEPNHPITPTWRAGDIIKIRTTGFSMLDPIYRDNGQEFQLHFYYEDENKEIQTLRFVPDFSSEIATGDPIWAYEQSGYFLSDVPESLRDVKNQNISDKEKLSRHTRFVPAINTLPDRFNILATLFNAAEGVNDKAKISVVADEDIISSPNNPYYPILYLEKEGANTVLNLGDYFAHGYVGIPYECEFETLDLETAGERTVTDAKKLINAVGLGLMETRGGFAGIPEQTLENMTPIVTREDESFNNQTKNFNGHIVVHIPTEWNEPGRATIKHVDPSPISILSVYPKGIAGD